MKKYRMSLLLLLFVCIVSYLSAEGNRIEYSYGTPISNIVSRGDFMYFTNDLGFVKYQLSNNTKTYLPNSLVDSENITLISVDLCDRVWYVSRTQNAMIELHCIDGNQVTVYSSGITEDLQSYLKMFIDNQEKIWIGTYSHGLICFDTVTLQWTYFNSTNASVPLQGISTIYQDRTDNSLWVGTWANGLLHYQNNSWSQILFVGDITINYITSIVQTFDGVLWIGTYEGLIRKEDEDFTRIGNYIIVENLIANYEVVFIDSYESNLKVYNIFTLTEMEIPFLDPEGIAFANGTLYAYNYTGLYRQHPNISEPFELLKPGNFDYPGYFRHVQSSPSDNTTWVSKGHCLASLSPNGEWTYFTEENTEIDFSKVTQFITNSNNELWALLNEPDNCHFIMYNGQSWTIFPVNSQLETNSVWAFAFDHNNRFWMSVNQKLAYFEDNEIHLIVPNGNPNYNINSKLIIDEENNVWFCGITSIYKYIPTTNELVVVQNGSLFSGLVVYNSDYYAYSVHQSLTVYDHGFETSYLNSEYFFYLEMDDNQQIWLLDDYSLKKVEGEQLVTVLGNLNLWNSLMGYPLAIDHDLNKYIIQREKLIVFNENSLETEEPLVLPSSKLQIKVYPNPFNPTTNISFQIDQTDQVDVKIYNIKGQLIKTFDKKSYQMGTHSVIWKGVDMNNNHVSSGVYFVRVSTTRASETHKMLMIK